MTTSETKEKIDPHKIKIKNKNNIINEILDLINTISNRINELDDYNLFKLYELCDIMTERMLYTKTQEDADEIQN